ncbi:hypothetical protein OU789_04265 [Halocynthiibacter sp. C4]|uniref:hypothetical protein n=1 Tax=Halocynthiibacter sp. C4 TaxID=2992758 RepID=UPI00237A7DB2|nr:hypothetical protein [Halocynthiibacter sp. C4]MDE0589133.1 hypothetical protein [Halocynthiibacter sp. C4]
MPETTIFLSPALATLLFIIAVIAGYRYRMVWKTEGPRWQLWVWGILAAGCLLLVGFIPLDGG